MVFKNMKTSTIKSITPNGSWSNGNQTFNKYTVELANGDIPNFSAIGDFKRSVGDVIYYTLDEKKNYAKLQQTPQDAPVQNTPVQKASVGGGMTQQESISRSVAWNNVSQFIFSEEFQKYDDNNTDDNGKQLIFSVRQQKMINQAASAANIIYKELLTKPE